MQIDESKILDDIKKMLSQSYPSVEISMETFLEYGEESSLNMSSLEIVEFIVYLESKYDIIIDFNDRYYTVGDTVRAVMTYLNEKDGDKKESNCEY